jgi:hypothetical protein
MTQAAEALAFYARHSAITDPGEFAPLFDNLPDDLPGLHQVVQNVYIHVWKIRKHHPGWLKTRSHEIESRRVERSLRLALAHDSRPLTEARPTERKLIVDCRHFAVLLTALLRHKGIPARARCGFATYLEKTHYQDHWITEYWNGERWIMEDPDLVRHDLPREEFYTGSHAWQLTRSGAMSDVQFGYDPHMRGAWVIRHDLVRDMAALNGFEATCCDNWGLALKDEKLVTTRERKLLDEAAAHTLSGEQGFPTLRAFYDGQDLLRAPEQLSVFNYIDDKWKTAPALD